MCGLVAWYPFNKVKLLVFIVLNIIGTSGENYIMIMGSAGHRIFHGLNAIILYDVRQVISSCRKYSSVYQSIS